MYVKTAILAAAAAAAFAGASIIAVTSSKASEGWRGDRQERSQYGNYQRDSDRDSDRDRYRPNSGRHLPRVTADGDADGRLPYHFKEWQARREAVEEWRSKVAARFGHEYSRWFAARDKNVNCDAVGRGEVRCVVSAVPARGGFWRFGGY